MRSNSTSPPTSASRTPDWIPATPANLIQRDANPSDVIDQAIIVPLPDDDRDTDTTLF